MKFDVLAGVLFAASLDFMKVFLQGAGMGLVAYGCLGAVVTTWQVYGPVTLLCLLFGVAFMMIGEYL